eukprot:scaffold16582_cov118-Isochrysis_galbana.AAC.2
MSRKKERKECVYCVTPRDPVMMCSLGSLKLLALAPHTTIVVAVARAPDPDDLPKESKYE